MLNNIVYIVGILIFGFTVAAVFFYLDYLVEPEDLAGNGIPWFEIFEAILLTLPLTILVHMTFKYMKITHKARMRMKELDLAKAESEQLLILGRLAASIAHEVRNPLNNMHLLLDELNRVIDDPDNIAQISERIKSNASRINHAIELVYRLARPTNLQQRLECSEYTSVTDLLQSLSNDIGNTTGASILVTNKSNKDDHKIRGDFDSLQTIFENLLRNAVLASDNTPVYVDIESAPAPDQIKVIIYNAGKLPENFTLSSISDIKHSSRNVNGLGLGLIIVNELAKQLGMQLLYHSDDDVVSFEVICDCDRAVATSAS